MKKEHITLSTSDHGYLESLLSKGSLKARKYNRARSLLELNKGKTYSEVADLVGVSYATVSGWAKKYKTVGLDFLEDQPRSGRPLGLSISDRAKITALACSDPPEGYSRWSLRLLADKLVELEYVESISFKQVGNILKKTNYSLIEKNNGALDK